ncbi:MAG: acyltransferase family protein [Actinobacteria bacterium]|nr:acyltransferase family protein [Actinomycetota bacterium]
MRRLRRRRPRPFLKYPGSLGIRDPFLRSIADMAAGREVRPCNGGHLLTGRTRKMKAQLDITSTPADRDRYVDLLRLVSIVVVVFGHWLMAVVIFRDGSFSGTNALDEIEGIWILTWLLQVMPLFFFVGGFSNLRSWTSTERKGLGYPAFLSTRVTRLIAPVLVFVAVWLPAAILLERTEGSEVVATTELLAKPLWFLAVYVLAVALAPVMISLHHRYRVGVPAALVAGAIAVDIARIGFGIPYVGYLNFAFVWLFAHQLGFFYADGSLTKLRPTVQLTGGLAALGVLVALVSSGVYSPSMVGMATDRISNNDPPSICLIALTVWLVGLAMAFRPKGCKLLERPGAWKAVVIGNSMIMTMFLWHLTALFAASVILLPAGLPQPDAGTAVWWLLRPVWLVVLVTILAVLVAIFGRFERAALLRKAQPRARASTPATILGLAALIAALAGLAIHGFAGPSQPTINPTGSALASCAYLVGGYFLIRPASAKGHASITRR